MNHYYHYVCCMIFTLAPLHAWDVLWFNNFVFVSNIFIRTLCTSLTAVILPFARVSRCTGFIDVRFCVFPIESQPLPVCADHPVEPPADPATAPIKPGVESTIEINKDKVGLGLSIVGGSDTLLVRNTRRVERWRRRWECSDNHRFVPRQ